MTIVQNRLLEHLKKREIQGNLRSLKLRSGLVDFSSNDYLGLASNRELHRRVIEHANAREWANGSTGSRLLTGNSSFQMGLEARLANFFKAPAALIFNSGYTANLALMATIPQRGDTILYDRSIHACIKDGARLSRAKCLSFKHNDLNDLERKLSISSGHKFVVIESLYSMEGDYSHLEGIAELCRDHQAEIIIDEAHTTGWAGPNGRGTVVEHGCEDLFLARVHTFGKGMGVHGACVVGSKVLVEYLVNFARPFIYTTALPPHSVIAINSVLDMLEAAQITSEATKK